MGEDEATVFAAYGVLDFVDTVGRLVEGYYVGGFEGGQRTRSRALRSKP